MRLRRLRRGLWDVLAVCTDRGDCQVLDFLEAQHGRLEKQARSMLSLLDLVAEDGPPRNTELSHHITGEIWEFIRGDLRVLYFYDRGRVVVCANAFLKRGRKTPALEIDRAKQWLARYTRASQRGQLHVEMEDLR